MAFHHRFFPGLRFALLAVVATLALLTTACGDDTVETTDDGTTTTDDTVAPEDPDDPGDSADPGETPVPEGVTATGLVTDEDGNPIVGATYDIEPLDGQSMPEVELVRTTDDEGRYFLALARGRWLLTVLADGYDLAEVELDVPDEGVLEMDVVLTKS